MASYDGWEPLQDDEQEPSKFRTLGSGGQGTVYLARSPERVHQIEQGVERVKNLLNTITNAIPKSVNLLELAREIVELGGPDPMKHLGALKHFKMPTDNKAEEAKAVGRLESEVRALRTVEHPAVLKLLHENVNERFIVTEYHSRGTLAQNLNLFKGNALAALEAFRTLVDAVSVIHDVSAIHRDIKPDNIFVTASGNLVLGDFGIVFFREGGRMTTTYERVGSHYWMAPWAYKNERLALDELNVKLDVYPLGKVLWSMVSGRNGFLREEYKTDENNLEKLFPGDPNMRPVNELLAQCVVRDEKACTPQTAFGLRNEVDGLIYAIKARRGQKPDGAGPWPCRVCGRWTVPTGSSPQRVKMTSFVSETGIISDRTFTIFVCDHCGHVELSKGQ